MSDVISEVASAYEAELKRLENQPKIKGHDGKPIVMPVVTELVAAVKQQAKEIGTLKTHIVALEQLGTPQGDFYSTGSD